MLEVGHVAGALYLDLREEMGREGIGTVIDVRGPPVVADGPGRVVLTTYRLASSDVYALHVLGRDTPTLVTGTEAPRVLRRLFSLSQATLVWASR